MCVTDGRHGQRAGTGGTPHARVGRDRSGRTGGGGGTTSGRRGAGAGGRLRAGGRAGEGGDPDVALPVRRRAHRIRATGRSQSQGELADTQQRALPEADRAGADLGAVQRRAVRRAQVGDRDAASVTVTAQCRRETSGSSSGTSASAERPMSIRPPCSRWTPPASGPATTWSRAATPSTSGPGSAGQPRDSTAPSVRGRTPGCSAGRRGARLPRTARRVLRRALGRAGA